MAIARNSLIGILIHYALSSLHRARALQFSAAVPLARHSAEDDLPYMSPREWADLPVHHPAAR